MTTSICSPPGVRLTRARVTIGRMPVDDTDSPPAPPTPVPHQSSEARLAAVENWMRRMYLFMLVAHTRRASTLKITAVVQTLIVTLLGSALVAAFNAFVRSWCAR